jgi:hypothetical protein
MIYLIHYKNLCKCHNITHPEQQQRKKKDGRHEHLLACEGSFLQKVLVRTKRKRTSRYVNVGISF